MVGHCAQHVPVNLEVSSGQYTMYEVKKVRSCVSACFC